ncbi:MAG TPA: beta-ketoacyl synthase N-terminal-like domain-containing protein [Polyangiaceae bacterium]|nr:beta-ketoacyl synthase N-terminal-like domain-containing protein [Polyangiaceae bacterium]
MTAIAIVAFGAVSALGEGRAAANAGLPGTRAALAIRPDDELGRVGLGRPFAARAQGLEPGEDRAEALLEKALAGCLADLERARPSWRGERVGLVLGTSSGGMRAAERLFEATARGEPVGDAEAPTYFGPMARVARRLRRPFEPAVLVLAACASGAIAVGLASRWLQRGSCDLVLAGGFDEVTVFVAAGFESLRAVTASPPPRPFRLGRDGMALGEGAAVLALAPAGARPSGVLVTGFGLASDAVHLTAPDRDGGGLARAASAAVAEAGALSVDLVSAHATATPFNDAAESRALARALGVEKAAGAVVHPYKAQIGHTLGAAGALELLAIADAIERGVLPAAAGEGELDPDAPARLLERAERGTPRTALKVASAFGGANAALVLASEPGPSRPRQSAFVCQAATVDREPPVEELAVLTRTPLDRLLRADSLVRLALAAVAALQTVSGPLAGAGVIVGTALATLETNALFAARIRAKGARAAEPRRFPYTSPNAVAGECSIAFGLTGPSFSVGGGMHAALEALASAAVLVESGDADRMVVVSVDDVGPATFALGERSLRTGAVAVLVSARPDAGARARIGAIELRRGELRAGVHAAGHLALRPLLESRLPAELVGSSPPDGFARVALHPL